MTPNVTPMTQSVGKAPRAAHRLFRSWSALSLILTCAGVLSLMNPFAPAWAKESPLNPSSPTTQGISAAEMAQVIPTDPALLRGKLKNGLEYYILRHTQPAGVVELRLAIRAGSINENENERGVAHFLEHMVFNGTTRYPGNQMVDALEKMGVQFGADLNAYTGFDETIYILPIPLNNPNNLATGLDIMEELAFNATFDPAEVEQERSVIMEEWRASAQSAVAHQQEHNLKIAAKGSRYAERIPMGQTSVIQGATPELLRNFYKRWYRPDSMAIVVVGDIQPAQVEQMIEQRFAKHINPKETVTRPNNTLPNNVEPLVGVFKDATLTQNTVMLAHKNKKNFIPLNTTGGYIETLRASLMTNMINQRLQAQLDGSTRSSSSPASPPYLQAGVDVDYVTGLVRSKQALHWYAVAAPGQEAKTLQALHEEALRVVQHGFTQSELDRAVREHLTYLNNSSNNYQKATEYIRGIVEDEPLPEIAWERAAQRKYLPLVTVAEVNQVAREFIQAENRIALINSNSAQTTITPQEMRAILARTPQTTAYTEVQSRDSLLTKAPTAGKVTDTATDNNPNLITWTLSNGVKVNFKPVPNNDGPIIFSGFSAGGFSRLSDREWKQTQWGFNGLTEAGMNGLSKTQVNHIMAGKDLSMQLAADETAQGVSGKFNVKDSEAAFQMIHSLLTGVNKNPEAFNAYLSRLAASTANLKENRDALFENAIQTSLKRGSSRFTGLIPTEADWKNTHYDTIYRAYQNAFSNANGMQFTFVGKAQPSQIKQLSERYLGSLPSNLTQTNTARDTGERLDFSNRTIELTKGTEALAQVRLMFGGAAPYSQDDALALSAIAHALNIRLVERLREEEGGVYSPYVYAAMNKQPYEQYALTIGFSCAPDNIDKLIASTQDEVNQLIQKGIRPQDLLKFQQAERASYEKITNTNEFWVGSIEQALKDGQPLSSITNYPQRVSAIDPKAIQAVAKKYLSNQQRVTAILRPEGK